MIIVSQLSDGYFHVQTLTSAPERETYAVRALPKIAFSDIADARQAQRLAAEWADRNVWRITAIDRATGEEFDCLTYKGSPKAAIASAMQRAKEFGRDCYGFRAHPAI